MLTKKAIQRATTKKTPSALEAGKGVAANYNRSKEYKGPKAKIEKVLSHTTVRYPYPG
jgi:hypothetical protein